MAGAEDERSVLEAIYVEEFETVSANEWRRTFDGSRSSLVSCLVVRLGGACVEGARAAAGMIYIYIYMVPCRRVDSPGGWSTLHHIYIRLRPYGAPTPPIVCHLPPCGVAVVVLK